MKKHLFPVIIGIVLSSCSVWKSPEPEVYQVNEEWLVTAPGKYQATATKDHDLIHTRLDLEFDWAKEWVLGRATLTFSPWFYERDSLFLDAKNFDLKEISLLVGKNKKPLKYSYDNKVISIALGRKYSRTDTFMIYINYIAKPGSRETTGSAAISSDKGLYFINPRGEVPGKPRQIWTQGETQSNSAWFPTIDRPNQKTTQEMFITVDTQFVTLSNGKKLYSSLNGDGTRTDYWKMDLPHAPYLFMVAVGDFAVVEDTWRNSVPVNYYVEPAYRKYADMIFGVTPEMIEFYSDILDYDYPWPKYSQVVVRDFVSGAMENTTATVHYEPVQHDESEHLDNTYEGLIAHELFHQWFGDLVTCESWSNLALNESFATYGEYLWAEHKHGRESADRLLQEDLNAYLNESQYKKEELIQFYYFYREDLFDRHRYQKGGCILHMLRDYLGDDAFFQSLNHYLKTHEYKPVEYHDFRLSVEEVTGEDMNWFFDQWFRKPGHPVLEISHKYDELTGELKLFVEQKQDVGKSTVFQLPVAVDIYYGGKRVTKKITVKTLVDSFLFSIPTPPSLVNFDAGKVLVAEKKEDKTADELFFQFNNAPLYLDKYEALTGFVRLNKDKEDKRMVTMLRKALEDPFWGIRETAAGLIFVIDEQGRESLKSRLITLSQKDPEAKVRAASIRALSKFEDKNMEDAFVKSLNDPSHNVRLTSLQALSSISPEMAIQKARPFEQSKKNEILFKVGLIYANHAGPEKNEFLRDLILEKISVNYKYSLVFNYLEYLKRGGLQFFEENLNIFDELIRDVNNKWEFMLLEKTLSDLELEFSESAVNLENKLKKMKKDSPEKAAAQKQRETTGRILSKIINYKKSVREELGMPVSGNEEYK